MHKVLLVSEHTAQICSIERIIRNMECEVMDAAAAGIDVGYTCARKLLLPFTLAVLDMPVRQLEKALPACRRQNIASKLLALVPFDGQGLELHLVSLGADDVLALPVTRPRLEVTVKNLLRLHVLEYGEKVA